MPRKQPQLAKLSRPRLHRPVARERLFRLLDEAHEHKPAICVVGPPGAGKTTLVASWLDSRTIKGIWYQMDPGDADLATFFYYLGRAATPYLRKGQRPLPLLTPEYLSDIEGFSRRFFRELFSRLPQGATLVFDNYQEVPSTQAFHHLIAQAVEEVSPGSTLVAISRRDPPESYARITANENAAFVDWENLKLTGEEARAIAGQHRTWPRDIVDELHCATGGWAAGLVLALERARGPIDIGNLNQATIDATFEYFASQILSKIPEEAQHFLMCTAYLPQVSEAHGRLISGNSHAEHILEDLYRRHLFVHKRSVPAPVYWYHALFREFLQEQSRARIKPEDLRTLQTCAGKLLVQSGDIESARQLFANVEAWDAMADMVVAEAAALVGQGRWRLVLDCISSLPPSVPEGSQWLSYWLGLATMAVSPIDARLYLERSYVLACERVDNLCRSQAAAGVIQTYLLDYNHFRPLDPWIEKLWHAIEDTVFESPDAEIRVQSALLTALSYRKPDHPALDPCAKRVLALQESIKDANLRLSAATYVLAWGCLTGPLEMAERALPAVSSLWRLPEIAPLNAALAGYLIAWHHCMTGNRIACSGAITRLMDIGNNEGLPAAQAYAATIGAWLEMYACDTAAAQRWLDILEKIIDPDRPFDRATSDGIRAWLSLMNGEPESAIGHGAHAVAAFDDVGSLLHQAAFRQSLVWGNILLGRYDAATEQIRQIRELAGSFRLLWIEILQRVAEAHIALDRGDRDEIAMRLDAVFRFARERNQDYAFGNNLRPWMPRVCARALAEGIETEYVKKLIARFVWQGPQDRSEDWPWPMRIYTFGAFRVFAGDHPLSFGRKAPKKPMLLLKAIIAFGGRNVSTARIMDALWPDEDGDAAYHNLNTNLHRLRNLLGGTNSVLLENSRISLNEALVWTDVQFCDGFLQSGDSNEERVDRAIMLYRGPFLGETEDLPWMLLARERWKARFTAALTSRAVYLEEARSHDAAIVLYAHGMAADELAEVFYQGLIRCLGAQGRNVDALAVFRQLGAILRLTHRGQPSEETFGLVRGLTGESRT